MTSIDTLDILVRTRNALMRGGIFTVEEVLEKNTLELLAIPNFGQGSLDNLRVGLLRAGYGEPSRPITCPTCGRYL